MIFKKIEELKRFDKYVDESELAFNQIVMALDQKLKYIEIYRNAHLSS